MTLQNVGSGFQSILSGFLRSIQDFFNQFKGVGKDTYNQAENPAGTHVPDDPRNNPFIPIGWQDPEPVIPPTIDTTPPIPPPLSPVKCDAKILEVCGPIWRPPNLIEMANPVIMHHYRNWANAHYACAKQVRVEYC